MGSFQNDDDLYLGAVYVPPHDSRFNTADEMSLFEVEITNMAIAHKYSLLMGGFNARTHNKSDFIDADDFFSKYFEYDSLLEVCNTSNISDKYGFSREQTSHNIIVNQEGNILLDICKSNNLFIMNGMFGDDKFKGAMTFRNCSVVDYSIVSHQLLKHIEKFQHNRARPHIYRWTFTYTYFT